MYDYYRLGGLDRKAKRRILGLWRRRDDYWYSLVLDRIRSFMESSYRLLVVRSKGMDALDIVVRVLERDLGYTVKVYHDFVPEHFLTGFKNLPSYTVPVVTIPGARLVLYSTRKELKQLVSGRKKALGPSLSGDVVDLFEDGVLTAKASTVPLYRWHRKVVVVDTDVDAEPYEVEHVTVYPWRPYALYTALLDAGFPEEDAVRMAGITRGNIQYLMSQAKHGGYIVGLPADTVYRRIFLLEHGDYSEAWRTPRHIVAGVLLGVTAWTQFGQPVDIYGPKACGLDYINGRNIIGVGTDIDCLHEMTGYKYRFIISAKERYRCMECPFRDSCTYYYMHPNRCPFR